MMEAVIHGGVQEVVDLLKTSVTLILALSVNYSDSAPQSSHAHQLNATELIFSTINSDQFSEPQG
jgi:hypothetical protein